MRRDKYNSKPSVRFTATATTVTTATATTTTTNNNNYNNNNNVRGFSLQTNYTHRATAACRRN
jgi:hypothetical protein